MNTLESVPLKDLINFIGVMGESYPGAPMSEEALFHVPNYQYPEERDYLPLEAIFISSELLGLDKKTKGILYNILNHPIFEISKLFPKMQMRLYGLTEEDVKDDVLIRKAHEFKDKIISAAKKIPKLHSEVSRELVERVNFYIEKYGLKDIFGEIDDSNIELEKEIRGDMHRREFPQLYNVNTYNKKPEINSDFIMEITDNEIRYNVILFPNAEKQPEDDEATALSEILNGDIIKLQMGLAYTTAIPQKATLVYESREKIKATMESEEFAKLVDLYRSTSDEDLTEELKDRVEPLVKFGVNVDEINKEVDDYINNQRQEYQSSVSQLREKIFGGAGVDED